MRGLGGFGWVFMGSHRSDIFDRFIGLSVSFSDYGGTFARVYRSFGTGGKRRQFKGSLPLSQMSRLQGLLFGQEGEVGFDLRFGKDGRIAAVTGSVRAELRLQCQCCLGSIPWAVNSQVSLGVVRSIEEADRLPEGYEPLLLEGNTIALADIVQDELLLAIPAIPQHEQCGPDAPREKKTLPETSQRPNPFAVLANLK